MSQKRTQYVKTANGLEKQLIASSADIVEINTIDGLDAKNVQDALIKIKDIADNGGVTGVKGNGETNYRKGNVNITPTNIGLGNVTNHAQVKRTEMGVANGVATLGADGKVPSGQLPSYVDDVLEYDKKSAFPATGETGKIYVTKDTNLTYRWSGTSYVEISSSLALGETSSTAYAGDMGDNCISIPALIDSNFDLLITACRELFTENKKPIEGKSYSVKDLYDIIIFPFYKIFCNYTKRVPADLYTYFNNRK